MEIWKDVPGYEGLYQASNVGRIRSIDRYVRGRKGNLAFKKGVILRPGTSRRGYLRCVLVDGESRKNISVHRLVIKSFIGGSGESINHINGIKSDNRIENLEWCSVGDNNRHARRMGLNVAKSGEANHSYGLKYKYALVLKNIDTGDIKSVSEVAAEYPYSGRHITMMVKGERTNKTRYVLLGGGMNNSFMAQKR